jgi:hypothetical protein
VPRRRWPRMLGRILYWLTVIVVALVAVAALILLLESRDSSTLEGAGAATSRVAGTFIRG